MKRLIKLLLGSTILFLVGLVFSSKNSSTDSYTNSYIVHADIPSSGTGGLSSSGDGIGGGDGPGNGTGASDDDGCFPAGTLISTTNGEKKIQDVQIGDIVQTFDPETGAGVTSAVIQTMKHSWEEMGAASPLIIITHEKGTLTLTTNHPVYKKGSISKEGYQDFENAGMLKVGDYLTLESGEVSKITTITEGPQYDYVYNIEVDKVHTYNADGVRVHNK